MKINLILFRFYSKSRRISVKFCQAFNKLAAIYAMLITVALPVTAQSSVANAIEQAHQQLWSKFIDRYGIIHDFVGEIPTPEDCTLGRPNAIGWWSPIENGPFFTGLYLTAACERARRSGNEIDRDKSRRLADGLLKCASVSDVPGFIARGVGTDGKCHYPLGSADQTVPWYLGLSGYLMSDIPSPEHREQVFRKMEEVTSSLLATDWRLPCDGAFKNEFRGNLQEKNFLEVTCYLFVLKMMHRLTKDNVWNERYKKAAVERPHGSSKTRLEICAAGYRADTLLIGRLDIEQLWIYVKNQITLVRLIFMETDEAVKKHYQTGLAQNVQHALEVIDAYKNFDNNDSKIFGHTDWRQGYPYWVPQKTQADAEKLAQTGNKERLGERKLYERRYMTNPLAAAAIVALAGDDAHRKVVEDVIRHYDYSKLHLSEFFFAEVAYYALSTKMKI